MALLEDLVSAAEQLRQANGQRIEAMATLVGLTHADIKRDLGEEGDDWITVKSMELIANGRFEGRVSLHVLLAALRDAWRCGIRQEQQRRGE